MVAGNERTNKIIAAAQQFHKQGISSCGATPHSVNRWQECINLLPKSVDQHNRNRTAREILMIINELEKVKSQTTVYDDAVKMMSFANKKLTQLR